MLVNSQEVPRMSRVRSDGKRFHLFCNVIGIILICVGLLRTLNHLNDPIFTYDEGFLLTHSDFILSGKIPFKDFYTPYPPQILFILAGLWKIFGVNPLIERLLGLIVHLAIAVSSGYLVRMISNRFSFLTSGLVLFWLTSLGCAPYTWLCALGVTFVACIALLNADRTGGRFIAGFLIGAISWFRHDLFIYFVLGITVIYITARFAKSFSHHLPDYKGLAYLIFGMIFSTAIFWIPVFAIGGLKQAYHDLYLDQVRYVRSARIVPFPSLFEFQPSPPLSFQIPAFLNTRIAGGNLLILTAPIIVIAMIFLKSHLDAKGKLVLLLLLVLQLLSLIYLYWRNDVRHVLYLIVPALMIFAVWIERLKTFDLRRILLFIAILFVLIFPARINFLPPDHFSVQAWQKPFARYGGLPEAYEDRKAVLTFISENTKPSDAIYVGLSNHENLIGGETDLYYLSARPAATRYVQFEPNVVNRDDVQREMIAEIEKNNVKAIVLTSRFTNSQEPNESQKRRSKLLDEFLLQNYAIVKSVGAYTLLWHRSDRQIPNIHEEKVSTGSELSKRVGTVIPGKVSLFKIGSALASAPDISGIDLFDISRDANIFRPGHRQEQYEFLKQKSKEAQSKKGYRKYFHEGLVHTATMMVLVELSAESKSVPPVDEFLMEFNLALRSINQSGETGKAIATHLNKLEKTMDTNGDGSVSQKEAEDYLQTKIRSMRSKQFQKA